MFGNLHVGAQHPRLGCGPNRVKRRAAEQRGGPVEPCIAEADADGDSGGGDPELSYPGNLTLGNLRRFLPLPTLVYQLSYPRSTRFRGRWLLWCAPRSTAMCPFIRV